GAPAQHRQTGRSTGARPYAHHRAEGPQAEDGRGLRPQGPPGVPGHRGGYQRARVPDADPGWRDARHVAEQDGADLSMRHIISLLLENEPGALSRVVGLFSQRNYNIESLTVAPTEDPTLSRLTLTTIGHEEVIEQITKNLNKLIEVVKLVDLSESAHIERELMLVKVKATGAQRAEVKRTTDIFRGQIADVTPSVYTIQLADTSDKLDSFIQATGTASILETVRSGVTGIDRGDKVLSI